MATIMSLYITTAYPRGYGRADPRLVTGSAEISTGPSYAHDVTHTLSPTALGKIAQVILDDFANTPRPESDAIGIIFEEADLPPLPATEVDADA
jgi:hypothetical protein